MGRLSGWESQMDRWQLLGVGLAVASAGIGAVGLLHTEPLPLSAKLGTLAPLDTNGDGRLSKNEWVSSGKAEDEMSSLDANGNGYLDPEEVETFSAGRGGDN